MAAKFFTGLPLDGPDPECVLGHGVGAPGDMPPPGNDHSHRRVPARRTAVPLGMPGVRVPAPRVAADLSLPAAGVPARPCDSSPLAGVP